MNFDLLTRKTDLLLELLIKLYNNLSDYHT